MTSVTETERDNYSMINFEETELRLGLPGGSASEHSESPIKTSGGKRGFSETSNVDLKLNLSPTNDSVSPSSTIPLVPANKVKDKTSTTAPPRAK